MISRASLPTDLRPTDAFLHQQMNLFRMPGLPKFSLLLLLRAYDLSPISYKSKGKWQCFRWQFRQHHIKRARNRNILTCYRGEDHLSVAPVRYKGTYEHDQI